MKSVRFFIAPVAFLVCGIVIGKFFLFNSKTKADNRYSCFENSANIEKYSVILNNKKSDLIELTNNIDFLKKQMYIKYSSSINEEIENYVVKKELSGGKNLEWHEILGNEQIKEDDIKKFYDNNKDKFLSQSFEQVKNNIKIYLENNKINELKYLTINKLKRENGLQINVPLECGKYTELKTDNLYKVGKSKIDVIVISKYNCQECLSTFMTIKNLADNQIISYKYLPILDDNDINSKKIFHESYCIAKESTVLLDKYLANLFLIQNNNDNKSFNLSKIYNIKNQIGVNMTTFATCIKLDINIEYEQEVKRILALLETKRNNILVYLNNHEVFYKDNHELKNILENYGK